MVKAKLCQSRLAFYYTKVYTWLHYCVMSRLKGKPCMEMQGFAINDNGSYDDEATIRQVF
jgi:hypothetical protein